ncbi:archease [Candidatus Aminicenantes bacterium AH-873-B07]|jgi:SHS2 domain-containing protein|nr:archease [Candidatus Aminicenantes bacterium AH-873-B07]
MKNYKYFSTTADMGIEVIGENISQIFLNAAKGMFNLISSPTNFKPKQEVKIKLKGESWEELLFKWLGELLFYYDAYKIYFVDFQIIRIIPFEIEAVIKGERIKNKKVEREIKAVTYHNLKITQKNDIWEAKVLFDL